MCTPRPRNVQLPLRPRTLLITDVTRLQPFTVGGDTFRENIETLVSYNVRTDGIQQDCLYIEQGHLMTPTMFMTYSMAIDPRQTVVVTWTPIKRYSTPAGLPALISTGITLVYFLLKAYQCAVYALSHKTEGRLAAATPSGRQQEHSSIEGEEGHTQVHEQVFGSISNRYGAGIQQPSGSVSLSRRRKDICIAACRNAEEYSGEPSVRENGKRLQSRGNRSTKNNNGQRPSGAPDDSTGVFAEGGSWTNAANEQSRNDGRTSSQKRSDQNTHDGIPGPREPEKQVSDVALQTDTCDTLYVTKSTLTAYTIAIVQNSQALQYDQMHAALQSARNLSSLELH